MLAAGTRIGPYEVVSAIGAGGMGEVYRARDPRLNLDVAIKVLPPSFSSDPQRPQRFEQEARATAALNHPNILAVHDTGQQDGSAFFAASPSVPPRALPCASRASFLSLSLRSSSAMIPNCAANP